MGLNNVVRLSVKMLVVYKQMACDGAKSNVAKWNLIGRIKLKQVKKLSNVHVVQ